jgi:hypothetical protein
MKHISCRVRPSFNSIELSKVRGGGRRIFLLDNKGIDLDICWESPAFTMPCMRPS